MVGIETSDDAAVYRLNDEQALIATTDFFMPVVDDPFDFGRIAATNAISDVYAMGGTPIMALAIVGMPVNQLPHEMIGEILRGGQTVCADAGIPIAGGHTIDSVEPIYGLVVMGIAHPDRIRRNADARAGDQLILSKPLGVGILSAALKKQMLDEAGYAAMIATTTQLNRPGQHLSGLSGVHALTDVTGFGLCGRTRNLPWFRPGGRYCIRCPALAARDCRVCRTRHRDRRFRSQLAGLRASGATGRAHQRGPARHSDRSANFRWLTGQLCTGSDTGCVSIISSTRFQPCHRDRCADIR
jgi:hypothetical protein